MSAEILRDALMGNYHFVCIDCGVPVGTIQDKCVPVRCNPCLGRPLFVEEVEEYKWLSPFDFGS